jgi:hypothetical protein
MAQPPRSSAFVIDAMGIVANRYIGKSTTDRPKNEDLIRVIEEAENPSSSKAE